MITQPLIPTKSILNSPITALPFDEQMFLIFRWARARESRMVCLANVHMLMEAYWHSEFASVLKAADLVAPDGMPLVWMLRNMGNRNQDRVAGMDVFMRLCQLSSSSNVSIFFVGSETEVLEKMKQRLNREFPNLQIAGMEPLPFRPLTIEEDNALIEKINTSGAGIVFVCLGCPKQEYWMLQHQHKIKAVSIGIGAVFAVYAGLQHRAPRLMRNFGLEWFYRLMQEPHRLGQRYGQTIPPFMWLSFQQLLMQLQLQYAQESVETTNSSNVLVFDPKPSKIGEILVRQNLVSETVLSRALEEQRFLTKKLGEILIDRQYISQAELEYHLRNQKIKLGELLVERQLISESRLNRLLNKQKLANKKLGEIIVQQKILSGEQLQQLLIEQYWRHKGLWLAFDRIDKPAV